MQNFKGGSNFFKAFQVSEGDSPPLVIELGENEGRGKDQRELKGRHEAFSPFHFAMNVTVKRFTRDCRKGGRDLGWRIVTGKLRIWRVLWEWRDNSESFRGTIKYYSRVRLESSNSKSFERG